MVEALIASGHPGAMGYSIRQVEGFTWLLDRRQRRDNARQLQISMLGARGDKKTVDKKLKEWTK